MKKLAVTIPTESWGGLNTKYSSDSKQVGINDLTGGSKNFDSDVNGALRKRDGGINYEQSADADGPNKDQFEAIFTDGVHHLLKVVAGKLKFSSGGGTFTTVTTGYSTLGNFEFALFQDRVYFGNGINNPQVYDRTASYGGVGYSVPQTKDMGAQAPSTAPTATPQGAAGNVPAGGHTYKVTFVYYDSEESNGGPASAVATAMAGGDIIDLTSVPIGGYGVTARKIYRDDNDGNYLLVGQISDNTTTTFQDNESTGTAAIPLGNNVPPSFKYIVTHLDRTWIAGIPGDPSTLRFSEAGLPDIFPSANQLLCNPEDPITAIVVYDRKVWVFNRNSIGRIIGSTRDAFQYVPLPGSIGCVDNRSIQVRTVGGVPTLTWLASDGIYETNGSSVEYRSDFVEDLVNFNIQQASQVKGQNAQTTQSQFQAGTASPGIDLTSSPGFITTPNPRRLWDDEADWEGGSSLTNVATNSANQLKVPTRHAPAFSSGTNSNTQEVSGTLRIPVTTDYTGESHSGGAQSPNPGNLTTAFSAAALKRIATPFIPTRSGTRTNFNFSFGISQNTTRTWKLRVWSDLAGAPNAVLHSQDIVVSGSKSPYTTFNFNISPAFSLVGGTKYWVGIEGDGTPDPSIGRMSISSSAWSGGSQTFGATDYASAWSAVESNQVAGPLGAAAGSISFTASLVATSGLWTGPIYDSFSDSAVAATIEHTGTFPAGTSSETTVEASDDPDMLTGVISQTVNDLNGSSALTLSGKRYWRIKIMLNTTDDKTTPQIGAPTLKFDTTAVWVSEAIDHTTDITTLDSLVSVTNVPAGTSVTVEIATSADDITYTSYGPIGSATVQRYSKVRVTLTSTADNLTTSTVTSVLLTWTLVSNLVSAAIDTGATPAGWDIFQSQFTTNGGTVLFELRTAATLGALGAASFVTVTNGTFPSNTELQFVQWRATLTSSSNTVPTVDSVTVNWFISQVSSIRASSIFFEQTYYLSLAEFNETTNNLILALDSTNKWSIYRGINAATLGLFFNDPYFGSATEGRIIRFLEGTTDQGTPIEMVIETKAISGGDLEHDKIPRKVYLKGTNTGAVYQVYASLDEGSTFLLMQDVQTGLTSYTTSSDGKKFRRRFQLDFANGNVTAGKTITLKVVEATAAEAEIDELKMEFWVRQGELV